MEGYIKKEDRKKILLLCDDIRMHSGIATMAREFVVNNGHRYNWLNVGAAVDHADKGKVLDLSADINKQLKIEDADVRILPYSGYGNAQLVRDLLKREKPDAIFIFTDPRYWIWLFEIEREVRSQIPIIWLNIWDEFPAPKYNENYYDSVDTLLSISKQTKLINQLVLGNKADDKLLKYIPHGIDTDIFRPIENAKENEEFLNFKKGVFNGKEYEFVAFFNSRNIQRKRPADVILAFKLFCDKIGKEKAKKCALVMHTAPVDQHGTDLNAVKNALCDPEYVNVFFSTTKINPIQMNGMYNLADVTMLISSNEGWGLSLTESMLAGTMTISNVTGGMQDQSRFVDENGEWYTPSADIPSNHRGTYKEHGEWNLPVFPDNISLAGSVPTPYIFDDRCSPEAVADRLEEVFNLPKEERDARGLKGREWAMSEEAGFTAKVMSDRIAEAIEETFETYVPRPRYDLIKVENQPSKLIKHKLTGY
jgi:glycosyltransferase involved in cell wall biosynthesis